MTVVFADTYYYLALASVRDARSRTCCGVLSRIQRPRVDNALGSDGGG